MKRTFWIFGLMVAFFSVFFSACGIDDTEIGFRDTPLESEDSVVLQDFAYSTALPGESQVFERAYENAPPLIPHDVEGMFEISKDMNMCVTCHAPEFAEAMNATPVPASHMYDTFNKKQTDAIVENRYNCNFCHVPQVNAQPLVGNNFKPNFRDELDKKKSNLLDVLNEGAQIR